MAIHGLTRVRFEGDKVIVVAGSVPQHIADSMVSAEPVHTPMTPVRHIPQKPNKPPRFVAPAAPAAPEKESNSGS